MTPVSTYLVHICSVNECVIFWSTLHYIGRCYVTCNCSVCESTHLYGLRGHIVMIINIYITVICHMITDIVNISISLIILHSYTLMKIVIAISPSVASPFITYYQHHTLNRHHAACDIQLKNTIRFPLASVSHIFWNSVFRSL
jgi:hypothetical protein